MAQLPIVGTAAMAAVGMAAAATVGIVTNELHILQTSRPPER